MEKSCSIYKTEKHYKMHPFYTTSTGLYRAGPPVFILDKNINNKELLDKIFECLQHSREVSEEEEEKILFTTNKEMLRALKEKSFKKLYSQSKSISIDFDENENFIRIIPTVKEKHYLKHLPPIEVKYDPENKDELIKLILKTLE